ncbi:acyl carrier protein [Spiroplasma endosymbiont of 'Nebria riversi']|uniref:acyl carrier protein n=1 Tax=Spiroplasma endosymbiont of 'Nebria riversi' TaxID=2792084 RepID=UPI001C051D6D|nr:phosphopantetheine-binding protein [Spiroplasma endosymbiont of 'Nebria riversi']
MNWLVEIAKLLKEKKGIKVKISLETNFRNLGLDSLELIDLIILAEEEYKFRIPDNKLSDINTVQDLIIIIEEVVNSNS